MKYLRIVVGDFQENCYILFDDETKEAAIIDPGTDTFVIKSSIKMNNLKVKYILLTHGHGDHIGAVEELIEIYPEAVLAVHAEDAHMIGNANINHSMEIHGRKIELVANLTLKNGSEIYLGDNKIDVIHTPGHTLGGVCYHTGNLLFSGDTLFQSSIGRTDLYGGDFDSIIKSIKDKLFKLDDDTIVLPGHRMESTIGSEKKYNPFLR